MLNKQITELEGIESHSEITLKRVEATIAAATPIELVERKQLFVEEVVQFKAHGVSLKEACGSTIDVIVDPSFDSKLLPFWRLFGVIKKTRS